MNMKINQKIDGQEDGFIDRQVDGQNVRYNMDTQIDGEILRYMQIECKIVRWKDKYIESKNFICSTPSVSNL